MLARGASLGRYVILDVLGSGGMGTVYSAYDPELDRKVAVKVIHERGDEKARARFVREARAIARLAHPNVVAVHDVGVHEDEIFIAMEHVAGESLKVWLAKPHTWREVVEIFAQAGRGLAASHARGLVHRDFKPGNVLIGSDGRVRVTDFGLARFDDDVAPPPGESALLPSSSSDDSLTETGMAVGTPLYMAPEQVTAAVVDGRSNQWSFAVALYEALYRQRPFLRITAKDLAAQILEGRVRDAPSGADVPRWLARVVRRGLRVDPAARYPTMEALLADLERGRGRGRRRATAAVAGIAVAALAAVAIARVPGAPVCRGFEARTAAAWGDATRASARAAFLASGRPYAADAFSRAQGALDGYATSWAAMRRDACEATQVRGEQSAEVEDLRMMCLDERLGSLAAIADLYAHADGDVVDRAEPLAVSLPPLAGCADVRALTARVPPPADPVVRDRVERLMERIAAARALEGAAKYRDAVVAAMPAVVEARALSYPPATAAALLVIADAQGRSGDPRGAEHSLRAATVAAHAGGDTAAATKAWLGLARTISRNHGRYDEAEHDADVAEAIVTRAGGAGLDLADVAAVRGAVLFDRGRFVEALGLQRAALEQRQRLLPPDHPSIAVAQLELSRSLLSLSRLEDALVVVEAAQGSYERRLGPDHPDDARAMMLGASVLATMGKLPEARALLDRALAIVERALGPEHLRVAETLDVIATVYLQLRKLDEAEAADRRALELVERHGLGDNDAAIGPVTNLANALLYRDRGDEAEPLYRRALALTERVRGPEHPQVAMVLANLANIEIERRRWDEARADLERATALTRAAYGPDHPQLATLLAIRAELEVRQEHFPAALGFLEQALLIRERTLGPAHPAVGGLLGNLANALKMSGRGDEALAAYQRGIAILEKAVGADSPRLCIPLIGMSEILVDKDRAAEALAPLERALALARAGGPPLVVANGSFILARALGKLGRDRARARRLALEAQATFRSLGSDRESAAVAAWLRR